MIRTTKWLCVAAASVALLLGCSKSGDQNGSMTSPTTTGTETTTGSETGMPPGTDTTGTGAGTDDASGGTTGGMGGSGSETQREGMDSSSGYGIPAGKADAGTRYQQ